MPECKTYLTKVLEPNVTSQNFCKMALSVPKTSFQHMLKDGAKVCLN